MTTLAWDGKILAVDSRCTSGSYIVSEKHEKAYKINARYNGEKILYFVGCGHYDQIHKIKWALEKEDSLPHDLKSVGGLLFTERAVYSLENDVFIEEIEDKVAMGSGEKFALAALKLGKTATEAVKLAAKLDIYTGGKIKSYHIYKDKQHAVDKKEKL